jgi:hypothetical protein
VAEADQDVTTNRAPQRSPGHTVGVAATFRAGLREPVILCLLLAAFFDEISGNPLHFLILVGTAVALAIARARERVALGTPERPVGRWGDAPRPLARMRSGLARSSVPLLLLPGAGFALVIGWFDRYSVVASLAVAAVGATAIALSWHGPLRDEPLEPLEVSGKTLWMLVVVALAGWELTNLFLQPTLTTDSWAHPTLSVLWDPILGSRVGRSVALFLWLRIGWGLVKR